MSVDAILERLTLLHPKQIDLSLGRVRRLLDRLGNPERRLPPIVHVAGTNGKGSVMALMRSMLTAAGYRVQAYTSPHLVQFVERVRLAEGIIAEDDLARHLEACEQASRDDPITFFEITTAAAFRAFAKDDADILLLEVGLGGRLDATNVIGSPRLTCITPLALDHAGFLGSTLAEIAREKAGILKSGVTCVLGPQPAEAMETLAVAARSAGAPLVRAGAARGKGGWHATAQAGHLHVSVDGRGSRLPLPALPGRHQIANAGLAVACLETIDGFRVPEPARAEGLARTQWPARLQRLSKGPLTDWLPAGADLWLDGGHNPAAAAMLAASLRDWAADDPAPRPLALIAGLMRTKDANGFLAPFALLSPHVYAVPVAGEKTTHPPAHLADAARALGFGSSCHDDVAAALQSIPRTGTPPRVLICGSLYLAGQVLRENGPPVT